MVLLNLITNTGIEGNVTAVKDWMNDTNGGGELDENDDIIMLSIAYTE